MAEDEQVLLSGNVSEDCVPDSSHLEALPFVHSLIFAILPQPAAYGE
jgi:hypothetical protein